MRLNLKWEPKTVGERVVFYSFCLVLVSPIWLHSRVLFDAMTAVAGVVVLGVGALMLTRRGSC